MKHLNTLTLWALGLRALHFALATSAACAFGSNALAEGFDTFGDQQRLENQAIIASGNIGKRMSAASYSNDLSYSDREKQTVFEIGRFCFKPADIYEDISGKAGLLLVDQYSHTSIAVITESISTTRIKMTAVSVLDCLSLSMQESNRIQQEGNRVQKQLQQQLETLKRQQAILDQMLKDQRAAAKKAP